MDDWCKLVEYEFERMVLYLIVGGVVEFMNEDEETFKQTIRVPVRCYAGAPYGIAKRTLEPS